MFLEAGGNLRLKMRVVMSLLPPQPEELDDLLKASLVHVCLSVTGRVSANETARTARKKKYLIRAIGFWLRKEDVVELFP